MAVFIGEIIIKTNVESPNNLGKNSGKNDDKTNVEDIVKQAIEKVFEILEQKKER